MCVAPVSEGAMLYRRAETPVVGSRREKMQEKWLSWVGISGDAHELLMLIPAVLSCFPQEFT